MRHFRYFMSPRRAIASLLARYGYVRLVTEVDGEVMVAIPLTEKEGQLVEEFRKVMALGMQQGGTVGCGGCPSAGECGPEIV